MDNQRIRQDCDGAGGPIRVVAIDDDPRLVPVLTATSQCAKEDIVVVATLSSPADILKRLDQLAPDVVLLATTFPKIHWMATLQSLRDCRPATAVLLLGTEAGPLSDAEALHFGARGFLAKPLAPCQLSAAICAAWRGLVILDSGIARSMAKARESSGKELAKEKGLSERQTRLLDCLALFLQDKEIADILDPSIPLAKKTARDTYKKLGVRTRAEAIVLWRAAR